MLALGQPVQVFAQTPPDAGSLRQQIERDVRPALPRIEPPKPAAPPPLAPTSGARMTVTAFRFAGNTLLGDAKLAPAVQEYVGRPLSFAELQQAAQAVARVYREAGWIVRAYLPQQDVTGGVVTIQVVEAVYSGARIEGAEPKRLKLSYVLSRFDAQQKTDEPLNARALDRALLLADDLPGVAVAGALREGENEGETELVLKLGDEPLLLGEAGIDNAGARSTGENRITLAASLNSPLGFGDQLNAHVIHSEGTDYGRLAFTVPVGNDGWRVGANVATLDYDLVAREFKALNGSGSYDSVGLEASYPLIRSRQHNLYLTFAHDRREFDNEANGALQSDYDINSWTLGLIGNLFDRLGGGGANALTLAWTGGEVDQGTANAGENPALDGRFAKLRYAVSRQQVLTADVSLLAAFSGQYGSKDVDSSERFYLGGPNGVRAYPVNEGSGSRAETVNLEVRWRLPENVVLSGFYDWGHVKNFEAGPSYSLKGYGVEIVWAAPFGAQFKAMLARRDGNNPNPTANGRDQDGSLDKNRLWLNATLPF